MDAQEILYALLALGFTEGGFGIGGDPAKIILWENADPQPTEEELLAAVAQGALIRERKAVEEARRQAYTRDADPLFFGWQRGKNTEKEWLDAVKAIEDAHPYPVEETE